MFKHLLCPTDFSTHAKPALDQAVSWAQKFGCSLELLHVVDPIVYALPGDLMGVSVDFYGEVIREREHEMRVLLRSVRERIPGAIGTVAQGSPATLITEYSVKSQVDLVVIGTDGHGAIARAILGSVADRVLRSSPIPILLVPCEGRAVSVPPKVILAPTDFSMSAHRAVATAIALAKELGASLTLAHAYDVPAFVERDEAMKRSLREAMAQRVVEAHPGVVAGSHAATIAREGRAAPVIVALAEETKADLIMMASTGRGFLSSLLLGGVTDRVARTSHVPVLVVRPAP